MKLAITVPGCLAFLFCVPGLQRAQLAQLAQLALSPAWRVSSSERQHRLCLCWGDAPRGDQQHLLRQGKAAPLLHRLGLNPANIMGRARKGSYKARLAKCLDFQLQNANRVHWALLQSQAYSSETLNYN